MKPYLDLIIVAGSPGSGKSTLCRELWTRWNVVPMIDLGDLRNFHLDRAWANQSQEELAIAFDHLVYIVHSYARHGWRPVLVTDLEEEWLHQSEKFFNDLKYAIITLFSSDEIITQRVTGRNSGFTNTAKATEWNYSVRNRDLLRHEIRIDSSGTVAEIADEVEVKLAKVIHSV